MPCSYIEKLDVIVLSLLPKLIYKILAILLSIAWLAICLFGKLYQPSILKILWKPKYLRVQGKLVDFSLPNILIKVIPIVPK
jgi:hypothetical protein